MQQIGSVPPRPRLRLAFLDSWLQSAVAGSGTAVGINGLADALRAQQHTVDRIAPPAHSLGQRLPITWRRLLFNLRLPWIMRRRAYHALIGFDFDGVWLPRRAPFICSIKGVIAEEALHEQGRVRLLFTLLAQLEGANARRADRVITTSEYCKQRIAEHYRVPMNRIGTVPEGIDVRTWTAALAAPATQSNQHLAILCVARHYARKHLADLLRAFAIVRRYVPHVRLRLVGDGPEFGAHVALAHTLGIADDVAFLGGIEDALVKREYAACDLFCLPSVQEGFGIVFLEAMVAGKPIVSTTAAAIPEVVVHGETGILVPPGDPHSLAGALLILLGDPGRRRAYGRAARERAEHYDWQRVADTFLAEIEHVALSTRSGDTNGSNG